MKVDIKEILELAKKHGNEELVKEITAKYIDQLDQYMFEYINAHLKLYNLREKVLIARKEWANLYNKYLKRTHILGVKLWPKELSKENRRECEKIAQKLSELKVKEVGSKEELAKMMLLI